MKARGYYSTGSPERDFLKPVSSGLIIYSKFPITQKRFYAFEGLKGADYFSSKGLLSTIAELPDKSKIRLITTHFQAHKGNTYAFTRTKHLKDFKKFMSTSKQPSNIATIFGGDFNISLNSSVEYKSFLQELSTLGFKMSLPKGVLKLSADCHSNTLRKYLRRTCGPSSLIDFIFTNSSFTQKRVEVLNWSGELHFGRSRHKLSLSDHHPISAVLDLQL